MPENIGFGSITRENYIRDHVTDFSNELYNPEPNIARAIAYIDGTYADIPKSSNFRALRQSYSVHKGKHLVKPALVVAPDGYILEIQGPYFSDSRNNDAQMLRNEFERDVDGLRAWFQENDIFVLDRGYRDALPMLRDRGISVIMPSLLRPGQRQFSTEEANASRLVTKTRWIVEARNGHLKSIFKFFSGTFVMPHVPNLRDFYRIGGALINRYHEPILMQNANAEMARVMLEKAREVNILQARVEADEMHRRNGQWIQLDQNQIIGFPRLTLQDLRDITFGEYQLQLAPSYIQDRLQREDREGEVFQLDTYRGDPGIIRVRIFSRFRNATKHQLWIAYNSPEDAENELDETESPILGYYCTCKSGARTLGTCAHVASILWFLGYARHERDIRYPTMLLLNSVLDAGARPIQRNPNHGPEIPMDVE